MKLSERLRKGLAIKEKIGRPYCAAVIVAAGTSSRMGGTNKILTVLENLPVICRTVDVFDKCAMIDEIIVVTQQELLEKVSRYLKAYDKMRMVVAGGETRTDSVMAGLAAVSDRTQLVAVHDGARPLVTDAVICRAVSKAKKFGAAAPAVRVKDTIKVSTDGAVEETPDRSKLYAVQTPQVFDRDLLAAALQNAKEQEIAITDDCSAVEALGMPVQLTDGDEENLKITTPLDLELAALILRRRAGRMRIGHGYDVHRLVSGRALILGGVTIPYEKGLDGHSDADVLIHAVMDALLGAAAMGDIGKLFPDNDDRYLGADSMELLREVSRRLEEAGYCLGNLDATIIAQRPKLAPYIAQMRRNIADALRTDIGNISVKATTEERLGFTGSGEGIAAHAVCLIE